MDIHLKIIGYILIALALVHIIFPRYFNWKNQLQSLSLINKQLLQVHTFFIAFTVFLMGLLFVVHHTEIVTTKFGQHIALGLGVFWSVRFIFQLFVYSTKLWRGKLFETTVHIVFSLLWLYIAVITILIYKNGL